LQQWRVEVNYAAEKCRLAPELIAAVMDRESLGGMALTPRGPKGKGDNSHGHGLMQIDDRAFPDFCADPDKWQDPQLNILFGAELLAKLMLRFADDVACAIAAYNAGAYKVGRLVILHEGPSITQLDGLTTGRNYVSDTLARIHRLQFGGEA
jgi:soluble lytic murein transglycosylase-like protein